MRNRRQTRLFPATGLGTTAAQTCDMPKQVHRAATALMTVAGLALALAVAGSVAFVTRMELLVSAPESKTSLGERPGR